jgi:hypothetical protein
MTDVEFSIEFRPSIAGGRPKGNGRFSFFVRLLLLLSLLARFLPLDFVVSLNCISRVRPLVLTHWRQRGPWRIDANIHRTRLRR